MKQFRKKPVVVEATQLIDNNFRSLDDIPLSVVKDWTTGKDEEGFFVGIPTLEGLMKARNNDWIIKGVQGEYYPCKPDIFEATYEPVQENTIKQEPIKIPELVTITKYVDNGHKPGIQFEPIFIVLDKEVAPESILEVRKNGDTLLVDSSWPVVEVENGFVHRTHLTTNNPESWFPKDYLLAGMVFNVR